MKQKKKTLNKRSELAIGIVAAVLVVAAIAALLIFVVFREDEMDRAERILREKDYLVTVKREGDDTPLTLEPTLRSRLSATDKHSANVIKILEFKEEAGARDFYDKMKGEYTLMQTIKRHGRYVYFGSVATYEMLK